ncbi:unnamed protein product [marine sediment metagenome]|uniref:Uncharacterized protein n=1 Tax=marine sediment metagenome TaxID=412755 RepID=X0WDY4_9ZZZZ
MHVPHDVMTNRRAKIRATTEQARRALLTGSRTGKLDRTLPTTFEMSKEMRSRAETMRAKKKKFRREARKGFSL